MKLRKFATAETSRPESLGDEDIPTVARGVLMNPML